MNKNIFRPGILSALNRRGKRLALLMVITFGSMLPVKAVKAPCVTPAMGWNSYDCYSYHVTESQFLANARYMAKYLKQYGWEYCVVDFVWWIPYNGRYGNNQSGNWNFGHIDQYGRFLPDTVRFPSSRGGRGFKPLADSVHNMGLKFGIHIMRGVPRMAVRKNCPIYNSNYTCTQAANQNSTCPWLDWMYGANNNAAGQAYYNSIFSLYDSWDVDFVKIDDLSAATYHAEEVEMYANAIAGTRREMVFSTSPGPTPLNQASHVMQYANQWRLVNDLWDDWGQITNAVQTAESWRNKLVNGRIIAGQGHWPDVDMIPFGRIALDGPVGDPRYSLSSRTKGEHRVLFFLFCISNNPLMWGGNLPDNSNDRFYDSLMMCRDAIFINQYGINGRVLKSSSTGTPVWVSTHPNDTMTKFLYLANTSNSAQTVSVALNSIGFPATQAVPARNVWTGANLGNFTGSFSQTIQSHDAGLYILGSGSTELSFPPVAKREKILQPAEENIRFTFTNKRRYSVPYGLEGKTVRITVYGLDGKMKNSFVTRAPWTLLFGDEEQCWNVGIVKITAGR